MAVRYGDWVKITGNSNMPFHGLKIGTLAMCVQEGDEDAAPKFAGQHTVTGNAVQYVNERDFKEIR